MMAKYTANIAVAEKAVVKSAVPMFPGLTDVVRYMAKEDPMANGTTRTASSPPT